MKHLGARLWARLTSRRPISPVDLPPPPAYVQAGAATVAGVATYVLLYSLADFWSVHPGTWWLLALAALAAGFGWLAWRAPRAAWGLTALALVAWLALYRYWPPAHTLGKALGDQWRSVLAQLATGHYQLQFDLVFGWLLLLLCGLAFASVFVRESLGRGGALGSLLLGSFVLASEWVQYSDNAAQHIAWFVPVVLVLWAVGLLAYRQATWAQAKRTVRYRARAWPALGLVGVVLLGMLYGPYNFTPVDVGSLGGRLEELFPWITELRGAGGGRFRFGMKYAGFSRDGNLGGPATPNDAVAFTVTLSDRPNGTLYLRGYTASEYTGRAWKDQTRVERYLTTGSSYLASQYPATVPSKFVTMDITPTDLFTPNLFAPLEVAAVTRGPEQVTLTRMDELLTDAPVRGAYQLQVRLPGFNGTQIRQYGLVNGRVAPPAASAPEITDWENNLQLPAGIAPEVKALAQQVTAGAPDHYTAAVMVEEYLRTSFPYTLDAPDLPADKDFVSFFLLEAKRGYCTSFASAMVVMLRSLGIPARWVEGYALPPIAGNPVTTGGVQYEARNTWAHAWVEAWFPGYGWVTFDPTPRADLPSVNRNTPLPTLATPANAGAGDSSEADAQSGKDQLLEPEEELAGEAPGGGAAPSRPWLVPGLLLAALLAAGGALAYRRLRDQGQPGAVTGTVVQQNFLRFVRLMSTYGFEREPGTTALEYVREISRTWPSLEKLALAVAQDFTALEYGRPGLQPSAKAVERSQELLRFARELLQHRYGSTTYYLRPLLPQRWRRRHKPVPLPEVGD
jgi:hypothetical protein